MSLSSNYLHLLPLELQQNIKKNLAIKTDDKNQLVQAYINKKPVSNLFYQYLGFEEYLANCDKKNKSPSFDLAQFANLDKLHYPYDFHKFFVNDVRLRNLPNIKALYFAQHNIVRIELYHVMQNLSDTDKEFLKSYEVDNSLRPINILAGQYQLAQIIDEEANTNLTDEEILNKLKALINKGVIFKLNELKKVYGLRSEIEEFLKSIEEKNQQVIEKAKKNKFTHEDLDKLGQEGEAQVNCIEILSYLLISRRGNLGLAHKLIEKGCNVDAINLSYNGFPVLKRIIENPALFNELKKYNFNINTVRHRYENILFTNNFEDNLDTINFFIDLGLNIEIKNNNNLTPYDYVNKSEFSCKKYIPILKQQYIKLAAKYFIENNFMKSAENLNLILKYSQNQQQDVASFEELLKVTINFVEMDVRQKTEFSQKLREFAKLISLPQKSK